MSAIGRANFYRANLYRARLCRAIAALAIVAISAGPAFAQALSFAPAFRSDPVLPQYAPQQQDDPSVSEQLPAQLRQQMVTYPSNEAPGTIIIDTGNIASTAPMIRAPSASTYRADASGCRTPTSSICTVALASEPKSWSFRTISGGHCSTTINVPCRRTRQQRRVCRPKLGCSRRGNRVNWFRAEGDLSVFIDCAAPKNSVTG